MSDYYDKQGNPLTYSEYDDLLRREGREYKRVAFDKVGDIDVSTVWLGMDHNWGGGEPLIFETMQFGGETDGECDRYSTIEEAQAAHDAWVMKLRDTP